MTIEKKPDSPAETALGCVVGLGLLLWVGSCVFSGSDEPKPAAAVVASPTTAAASIPDRMHAGDAMHVGATMLEQAILDAFPTKAPKGKEAKRRVKNATDYLGATINQAGFLCAKPVEAQQVATGQYGVGCRKYRNGGDTSKFIVDVRSGSVSEI